MKATKDNAMIRPTSDDVTMFVSHQSNRGLQALSASAAASAFAPPVSLDAMLTAANRDQDSVDLTGIEGTGMQLESRWR